MTMSGATREGQVNPRYIHSKLRPRKEVSIRLTCRYVRTVITHDLVYTINLVAR